MIGIWQLYICISQKFPIDWLLLLVVSNELHLLCRPSLVMVSFYRVLSLINSIAAILIVLLVEFSLSLYLFVDLFVLFIMTSSCTICYCPGEVVKCIHHRLFFTKDIPSLVSSLWYQRLDLVPEVQDIVFTYTNRAFIIPFFIKIGVIVTSINNFIFTCFPVCEATVPSIIA